ncbi:hypothetical protein A3K69_00485 [Candidatus Bathyarchaeota archaeon RBG_16_57_9]|nr:MAG: hypothetical protein A3K69_00485 [Candidatus Bathyarchaeota archaeon RBG_16_57_9]
MLQVAFTRVFSIALWRNFVWMIISIALLGYAASGTFQSVLGDRLRKDFDKALTVSSALFSASTLLSYLASNQLQLDPFTFAWDSSQLLNIGGYYALLLIPFFFSGLTLGLMIEGSKSQINRVYFSSFLGSSLGTLLILPLFAPLGGPGVIVVISIVGGVSAMVFASPSKRLLRAVTVYTLALSVILLWAGALIPVEISPYKSLNVALRYPGSSLIETRWNAFSRIDVVESGYVRYAPGLSLRYGSYLPEQIGVFVDGDEVNAITRYDGRRSSLDFTGFLPTALPYALLEEPRVLIVDAGGGLGILTALYHGSSRIMAVEDNPIIVDLVRDKYASFSGSIYQDEKVEVQVSDGRSFIQGRQDSYDLIELSMTGGASASSTGIYALSEDYLYTVESFSGFIGHLSENGFFSVSRWLLPPPREDVRVVSLAIAALESMGVSEPWRHLAVIRSWGTINLVVGRSPLSQEEISAVRLFCRERGFDIVYVPGVDPSEVNVYNRFPEPIYYNIVSQLVDSADREEFYSNYLYDISPTTDDKPFFFNFFKWDRLVETYDTLEKRWQALIEGGFLVPIVLLQALALSILIVILPLYRLGGSVEKSGLLYFFLIGLGYMFIEITTIQRFILILGNSVYSISMVLFSLLLSSGLGSYYSGRIEPRSRNHMLIIQGLGGLSILYGLIFRLEWALLGLDFGARLLLSFIFIFPLGFLMGMPFPIGIRMHEASGGSFVGWAWAVNGCASVLGSIIPVTMALYLGFPNIYVAAGVLYLLNVLLIR